LGVEIETLDTFRLARGCLEAFVYLEENGYVLTQFDEHNIYATSFSEDRANFFRIMFKGHKDKNAPFNGLERKHKFSPPEKESKEIYKSYAFSTGLMVLWAVFKTYNKEGEFPNNIHSNPSKLKELIKTVVDLCYKEGKGKAELKDPFDTFLSSLLEPDIGKRESPKELLKYKWISECDKLDDDEYRKECEAYEEAKKKEKEEEDKNKFS